MVAYDTNGLQNQFLQGWLIQDRYLMMTPFGAPYEFLWANPYQPGRAIISFRWCFIIPIRECFLSAPDGTKTPTGLVYTMARLSYFTRVMSRW